AVARMQINDHSWVHIQIVANIGLKLLRQLTKHHIQPSVVHDYGYDDDDAEVVVALAAFTHCIGMSVHREGHEDFSLFLAEPKLRELLDGIYEEPELTVITSEVLQAITSHRDYGEPRPILIEIKMNNSSGIYQVDGLLKAKLSGSGLEPYVEVVAHIDTEAEKKLVPIYRLES